jgi:uncharacterized protein (TIGR00290 family)
LQKAIFNWSGGKDSSLALYKILKEDTYRIESLLTTLSRSYQRVSMHGVRETLLEIQSESLGLPLQKLYLPEMASMEDYNRTMFETMSAFKKEGIDHAIFGDIFLEDLKIYREDQLLKVGIKAVFPLWGRNTKELLQEFIDEGFKAVIVCINEKYLDKSFAGRFIDKAFMNDLPDSVDPCGENGEYHSFVFDGPIFSKPVVFDIGETVFRKYEPVSQNPDDNCGVSAPANYDTGFWYCDLVEN